MGKSGMNDFVPAAFGIKGYARAVLYDAMGNAKRDTGWFPNVITDTGMLSIRDGTQFASPGPEWCEIGTSTTAPTQTDTFLFAPTDGTRITRSSVASGWSGTTYFFNRIKARFNSGVSTGNIGEMAWFPVSTATGTNGTAFTHARIVDGAGLPTQINKGVDDILDVFYELRNYPPTGDVTGSIDISGVAYNYILRGSRVGQFGWSEGRTREVLSGGGSFQTGYDGTGTIGPLTGSPTGNAVTLFGVGGVAFTVLATGIYFNDVQLQVGLDGWVFGQGLRSVRFTTGNCNWQVRYGKVSDDTPIMKTAEERLRLKYRLAWARI